MSSESVVQQQAMLYMARMGGHAWRNNVGACVDDTGRQIRYGLANTSASMNQEIKSSDVIGVTPVLITPAHVGQTLGVFTALECKPSNWKWYPSDKRAPAQAKFHDIVRSAGGYAGFVLGNEYIPGIIMK